MPRNVALLGFGVFAGLVLFGYLIILGSKPVSPVSIPTVGAPTPVGVTRTSAQTLFESYSADERTFSATYGNPLRVGGKVWMADADVDNVVLVMADVNNQPIARAQMRRADWGAVANLSSGSPVVLGCDGAVARDSLPYLLNCRLQPSSRRETSSE